MISKVRFGSNCFRRWKSFHIGPSEQTAKFETLVHSGK